MVSNNNILDVIQNRALPVDVAEKYLKLYVADVEWSSHIASLWKNFLTKFKNEDIAKENIKKAIACTILLPFVEKTQIPDPPSNLLFWVPTWKQYNENDWFDLFIDVLKEDLKISNNRNKLIQVGVIDPIDIGPLTRQAYNWIYERTENFYKSDNSEITDSTRDKIQNLIRAYGGAIICNVFTNHKLYVDKVFNWRSCYFFEKQLHKAYSIDQMIKIKNMEINKTNSKYVKKIGAKNV